MSDKSKSNSKPRRRYRPRATAVDSGSDNSTRANYTVVTDAIGLSKDGDNDSLVYSALISPSIKFSNNTGTNPFRIFASNYEKIKFLKSRVKLVPLTSAAAISGYTVSMAWFTDASEAPTSLQPTNLKQNKYFQGLSPGTEGLMHLPQGKEYLYVDATDKAPNYAFHGQFMIVIHGIPVNSYTNTRYTGPLFRLEWDFTVAVLGYSAGNIPLNTPALAVTEDAAIVGDGGVATLQSEGLLALSNNMGESGQGNIVYQAVMTAADTVAGVLPFPLNLIAKVGLFFVRRVVGNGGDTFRIYRDYQTAVADAPVKYSGRHKLGEVALQFSGVSNGAPVVPVPQHVFRFDELVSGGIYEFEGVTSGNAFSVAGNWPTEEYEPISITDLATGATAHSFPPLTQWKMDGQALARGQEYGYTLNGIGSIIQGSGLPPMWCHLSMTDNLTFRLLSGSSDAKEIPAGRFVFRIKAKRAISTPC